MTNLEAIRILEEAKLCSPLGQAAFVAIEAIKKQIPKKPIKPQYYTFGNCCPSCEGAVLITETYCTDCGQTIDWEEQEIE